MYVHSKDKFKIIEVYYTFSSYKKGETKYFLKIFYSDRESKKNQNVRLKSI